MGEKMQDPIRRYQSSNPSEPKKTKGKRKVKPKRKVKGRKSKVTKSSSKSFNFMVIFACLIGIGISTPILLFPEMDLSRLLSFKIDIPKVFADSSAKNKEADQELNSETSKAATKMLSSESVKLSMENTSINQALEKKRKALEEKERELSRFAENLDEKKAELDKQLKELTGLRRKISSVLDEKVSANKDSVTKLVGVYSNMKPANAATILTNLNEDLAVKVLGKMKKQNAAAILNYIEPKKAQTLSEKYAGLKQ